MDLDLPEVETRIRQFIKDYLRKSRAKGIVVGLSGGIDSATTAALSALAVGGDKVMGLMLPEKETYNPRDIRHAELVAKKFGFKRTILDLTAALNVIYDSIPVFDIAENVAKGNVKARTRMICIYYYANKLKRLVCGSSDKSETMMGYFTKWGDIAADISPLMDLYKSQVRKLAQHIGVPEEVIAKPPSPALWPGQLAEDELGMKYEQLDLILYGLEHFMEPKVIANQLGLGIGAVEKVKERWLSTEHKRRTLLTMKLQYRTISADFRLPRDPYSE